MKNEIVWLEQLKQTFNSPDFKPASVEVVKQFNDKLKSVTNFQDFLALQQEIIANKNLTFCSNIQNKYCILDRFSVLIHGKDELPSRVDYAMKQDNPEKVIRYYIFDDACLRIRSRMANADMLKKSLKVVAHDWKGYAKFVEITRDNLIKKNEEIKSKPDDNKYKPSMADRNKKHIEIFNKLLA
jgi:cyclopropane fatty-acyl-phospholipid synthase-like methyltransferase